MSYIMLYTYIYIMTYTFTYTLLYINIYNIIYHAIWHTLIYLVCQRGLLPPLNVDEACLFSASELLIQEHVR